MRVPRLVYTTRPFNFYSRTRGKTVSESEDEKEKKRAARKIKEPEERAEAWRTKQTNKQKLVVEHKTYEEMVRAAGRSRPR